MILPALIIAPHFEFPTMNGGDIYIEQIAQHLSAEIGRVTLLGCSEIVDYSQGSLVQRKKYDNKMRSKSAAALRTILLQDHYYAQKFLTPAFSKTAQDLIDSNPGSQLFFSYLVTTNILTNAKNSPKPVVITQNDERVWFENQAKHSNNPLQKWVSHLSAKWVTRFFRQKSQGFVFAHITKEDMQGYQALGQHRGFVLPAGVEVLPLPTMAKWDGTIRLLFCGSLGVKMNFDALQHFEGNYWPQIKAKFKDTVVDTVAGSNPSSQVRNLCTRNGWQLQPNLASEQLLALHHTSTFAILPFPYTTGAKIKLLNAYAAGLPVLATTNMRFGEKQDFYPNLYSNAPDEWVRRLEQISTEGISSPDKERCQDFASQYSWPAIIQSMLKELDQ